MRSRKAQSFKQKETFVYQDNQCNACGQTLNHQKFKDSLYDMLQCIQCHKKTHKVCYNPSFNSKQKFVCDLCSKRKKKEKQPICAICCSTNSNFMMKQAQPNEFVHIICALTNFNTTVVDSYKKMSIKLKEFKNKQKQQSKKRCLVCKSSDNMIGSLLKCSFNGCQQKIHLNCLQSSEHRQDWVVLYTYLDKNDFRQRNIRLIDHTQYLQFLKDYQNRQKPTQSELKLVCKNHNSQGVLICSCETNKNSPFEGCDACGRWFHKGEKKLSKEYNQDICTGCRTKNIYEKRTSFPQLIFELIQMEESKKQLQEKDLKFIDSFPLVLSTKILTKMHDNESLVRIHYSQYIIMENLKNKNDNGENIKNLLKSYLQCNQQEIVGYLEKSRLNNNLKIQLTNKIKHLIKEQVPKQTLQKIGNLTKKLQKSQFKKMQSLASQIIGLSEYFGNKGKNFIKNQNNLLSVLVKNPQNKKWVAAFLKLFHKKVKQEQYYKLTSLIGQLVEKQQESFKNMLSCSIEVQRNCVKKDTLCFDLLKNLRTETIGIDTASQIIIKQDLYIKDSTLDKIFEDQIYSLGLKKKFTKLINQERYEKICQYERQLMKPGLLNKLERQQVRRAVLINKFFEAIKYKAQQIQQQDYSYMNDVSSSEKQFNGAPSSSFMKILSSKIIYEIQPQFLISQMYILAVENVKFNSILEQSVRQFFETVFDKLIENYGMDMESIKPELLKKIVKVLNYTGLNESFPRFDTQYKKYLEWKAPLEKSAFDIQLTKQEKIPELLTMLEDMSENNELTLDMSTDFKKIKLLKAWCLISSKYFQCFSLKVRKKPTINAIQSLKQYADALKYPDNEILKKINDLDRQAKQLNKKISRFLDRPKVHTSQIYEQISNQNKKLTIKQANELVQILKKSNIDVIGQQNQLEQYIKLYNQIPKDKIDNLVKEKDIYKLEALKNQIYEVPIRDNKQTAYYQLIKQIWELKAQSFINNPQFRKQCNKKDIFKILNFSGPNIVKLLENNKTLQLLKCYKSIERAQTELLMGRKNQKNLLSLNDEKKIKQDIENDLVYRMNVDRWFKTASILRQRFRQFKILRETYQNYKNLQTQFMKLPISCSDISSQIMRMKRQIQFCSEKLQHRLQDRVRNSKHEEYIAKYRDIGMKHPILQTYLMQYEQYQKVVKMSRRQSQQQFHQFSLICQRSQQISKLQNVKQYRDSFLNKVYKSLINTTQPKFELHQLFIRQGSDMLKYIESKNTRQTILNQLLEINAKCALQSQGNLRQSYEGLSDEDNQEEDGNDMSEEQDDNIQIDYKRKAPQDIVQLDDDD